MQQNPLMYLILMDWTLVRDQGGRRFKSSLSDQLFFSRYSPSEFRKIHAVGKNATALAAMVFPGRSPSKAYDLEVIATYEPSRLRVFNLAHI